MERSKAYGSNKRNRKCVTYHIEMDIKIVLGILRLVLEVAKIFLLLLNLVFRVFMAFVGAGTP